MTSKKIIFAGSLLATIAMISTPVTASSLTGAQIKQVFSGKTLKFKKGKTIGVAVYRSNGKATIQIKNSIKDTGKWWVKKNTLCAQWKKIRKGKARCFTIKNLVLDTVILELIYLTYHA